MTHATPTQGAAAEEKLAALLVKAAPLAKQLNSSAASHEDRARLRELVGSEQYFELTNALNAMSSVRAWHYVHGRTERPRA